MRIVRVTLGFQQNGSRGRRAPFMLAEIAQAVMQYIDAALVRFRTGQGMKTNSASRIHGIMSSWKSVKPDLPALSGWQQVLSIESKNGTREFIRASERIHILVDEVDLLRDKLHMRGISASVYGPALMKLENALSPQLLVRQGVHVQQHLTDDVFTALAFCSEILPVEEDGISTEDFADVVSVIHDLELLLAENSMPSELTALLRRHIRLAEMALASYPLRGASAIRDAVKAATGDIFLSESEVSSLPVEQRKTLSGLWRRMNSLADKAIKVDNLVQLTGRVATFLENLAND